MKAAIYFVSMCLLATFVSSEFAWRFGQDYKYDVRGRLMTGVKQISNQNAGLEITYRMTIRRTGPETILLIPSNYKTVETNEDVEGGWRDGDFSQGGQVEIQPELLKYLEGPMQAKFRRGIIVDLVIPGGMPTWAENIKRAQASHWILDSVGSNVVSEGNMNRNTNNLNSQQDQDDMSGYFYKTFEQTVHGECETYYTVSQTGPMGSVFQLEAQDQPEVSTDAQSQQQSSSSSEEQQQNNNNRRQRHESGEQSEEVYQQGELPWPKAFQALCKPNDQIYEVVKHVNFTQCTQKAVFAHITPSEFLKCRPGDNRCGSNMARSMETRFLLCGTSRTAYTILKVEQDERFSFGLSKLHTVFGGIVYNTTLNSISPLSNSRNVQIQNPRTLDNLVYAFDPREQKLQKEGLLPIATASDDSLNTRRMRLQDSVEDDQSTQADQPRRRYNPTSVENRESSETFEPIKDPRVFNIRNQLPLPSLKQAPLNPFMISPLTREQLPNRIMELGKEVVLDIQGQKQTQRQPIAETETLSKLAVMSKAIRFLGYEEIIRLFQRVKSEYQDKQQKIMMNFLLDCICMAGTNPAILAINRLIESEEITGEQAAQLVMTYPAYIRHPTPELLNQIDQLSQTSAVQKQPQVKYTLVLAFANLLYQACMNSGVKQSRYPVAQYGEFCNPELVRSKYAPRFVDLVKRNFQIEGQQAKEDTVLYLAALGNLGCQSTIPVVQEIMDKSQDVFIKTQAIYALKRLTVSHDAQNRNAENGKVVDRFAKDPVTDVFVEKKVLPLLVSVAFDQTEHHSVRIAAIQLLTYCTYADIVIWQKLATSTWFEKSEEVKSFVYSTIQGWATLQRPLHNMHWRMQQKASAVLSLANPFLQGFAKSKNILHANVADHLASGEFFQISYTGSRDSNIPNNMYFRNYLQFGTSGIGVNAFEGSIHGRSISKLVDAVIEKITDQRPDQRDPHPELSEIKSLLGIEKRQMNEQPHGALYFTLRNEMTRMFQINIRDIENNWQNMKVQTFFNLKKGISVNYNKVLELAEHSIEMGTSLGVPLIYHYRNPMMLSLRGEVKLLTNGVISTSDSQLLGQLHPIYAWKTHGKIAFKVPFTGKKYQAGVQRHFAVEAPFRFSIRRSENKDVVFALTPIQLHQERPQGKIELVNYHQIPYTAVVTDELYPTIYPKGGKMEIVRSEGINESYEYHKTHGQDALGFALQLEEKSDYRQEKESFAGWGRFIQKFNGPISFFNLGWLGTRPIKFAERKIVLDLDRSPASTLVFAVGAKRQDGFVEVYSPDSQFSSSSSSSSESTESTSRRPQRESYRSEEQKNRKFSKRVTEPLLDLGSESSESSSGEQGRSNNEQTTRVNQRQRSVIVVLVTKKDPLPSVQQTNNIVKILQTGVNYVQYVALWKIQNGQSWLRLAAGEPANHATESFRSSTSSSSIKAVAEALIRSPNEKKQTDGCLQFKGKYEAPEKASQDILVVLRETLLNKPLEALANGELRFGKTCNDLEYNIQMELKLRRGERQTKWAQDGSPQAKQCAEDEKKGFSSSQVCLWVADNQAAVFNRVNLKLRWNKQMPDVLLNVTRKFEEFTKYTYYLAHSSNIVPEGSQELTSKSNAVEIKLNFAPDGQYVDAEVLKPKTRWELNSVKLNPVLKSFLPLRSTLSVFDTIRQKVLKNDAQRTCSVEGRFVSTFDNVTVTYRRGVASQGCYTLLAADCSGKLPMAVLAKDVGSSQQKVRVLLGGTTQIDIVSSGGSTMSRSRYVVKINGQEKKLPHIQLKYTPTQGNQRESQYIAKVVEMPNEGVQVVTKTIKVAYDGKRIVILSHPDYHNTTCGICGNNDGEKVGDMRSPRNVPLSRATLLVASYSYSARDDSDKCEINPKIKREIQQEEQMGLNSRSYSRNYLFSAAPQQQQQQQQNWNQDQYQDQQQQQVSGRGRNYG